MKARYRCARCLDRPAMSGTLQLCEVCAYAEATSQEAAERQAHFAKVDAELRKEKKRQPA